MAPLAMTIVGASMEQRIFPSFYLSHDAHTAVGFDNVRFREQYDWWLGRKEVSDKYTVISRTDFDSPKLFWIVWTIRYIYGQLDFFRRL